MSWKDLGFDENMARPEPESKSPEKDYISAEEFDSRLDATSLERYPLRLFTQREPAGKQGMTHYDPSTKKARIYVDDTGKWADLQYTTSSTSTSSSTSTTTTA